MNYENLLIEADKLGVIVKEFKLRTVDGKCYGNRIAINSSLTQEEKACVLAEELSHYLFTVGDITDQTNPSNRKQELIARRKSYEKRVTPEDIINSILSGVDAIYDLAEKLDVTEEILIECINHYKRKYGVYYVGKTHLLTFEPLNVIDFPN
ncbi:MAG: ImmA/IrrE family metallo-endopeptidase [Clostridium sp.]|uniref:ImmA/IrrE family metallo-endopeptidase n=1 Tax=Clostridium sp. TaxID=1506 RepID=UPI002A83A82F|nr:ImmA/IrrE family metallo-endopeptidase [Clostridium sp.]MCI6692685.1 ImmA/IrrE family metallo-endopeptidase [Clostridium sp.]MDY4253804.1 ImmA/IrrE family metallo-endopeptidase [Clostridium sp.]